MVRAGACACGGQQSCACRGRRSCAELRDRWARANGAMRMGRLACLGCACCRDTVCFESESSHCIGPVACVCCRQPEPARVSSCLVAPSPLFET